MQQLIVLQSAQGYGNKKDRKLVTKYVIFGKYFKFSFQNPAASVCQGQQDQNFMTCRSSRLFKFHKQIPEYNKGCILIYSPPQVFQFFKALLSIEGNMLPRYPI